MFKKDDKVKVVKGIKAFEGLTGTVLDTSGDQIKVKLNLSNDSELQKNLINVFEAYQLELESLDLLKEDTVSFDNDMDEKQICCICGEEYEGYGNNAEPYKEGRCCDECNKKFVIPDRINRMKKNDLDEAFLFIPDDDAKREAKKAFEQGKGRDEWIQYMLDSDKEHGAPWGIDYNYDYFYRIWNEANKDIKNESLKLTEEELKAWCSDNDANYYTQDIKDDKVIIRGLNEDLAEYDFKTKELKVFDYSGTTVDENELDEVEDDDNYIRDYVYDIDMLDEKTEIPSWEFASIIATAEDTTEDAVVTEAHDRGFKVYLITASNYEKLVIASEKITEEDIMEDFASYLEGSPKVTEVI